jgi:ketosteroid isomerase-like protein
VRERTLVITGLLLCAPLLAQAQTPAPSDPAALRREVEALNREMEAAFNRGDLKTVASFYADNAVVRTSRQVAAQGRAAIDRYFTSIQNPRRWKLDVYGVSAPEGSDLVFQTGLSTLVSGTPEHVSPFEFALVWKRQSNGKLRIVMDYYHAPERSR